MPLEYTSGGSIIRGYIWPPAGDDFLVTVIKDNGWPVGADGWTWTLRFSRAKAGGSVDVELTAADAVMDGDDIELTFSVMTEEETAALSGKGDQKFHIAVKSDGGPGRSAFSAVVGVADVEDAVGAAS